MPVLHQPRPLKAEPGMPASWREPFRPYVWRDRARVTPQRAAELAAIDRRDWGGCDQCDQCYQAWHLCPGHL